MIFEIAADNYLSKKIGRVWAYYSQGRNLRDSILTYTHNPSSRSFIEAVNLCVNILHPSSNSKIRDFPVNRKRRIFEVKNDTC